MDEPSEQEERGLLWEASPAGSRRHTFESEVAAIDREGHVAACRALQVNAAAAAAAAAAAKPRLRATQAW